MCCLTASRLLLSVCVCLISVINGELSVIKNTVVKKRTKQVNMWREMSEEGRRMERRQRWRRGGRRGDKGGWEEWSTWHKDARVQTIQHTNKAPNITTERLNETRWHTQTCSLHLTSEFRRLTSSDSTSTFRGLHHIVWNKYTAGFLRLTHRSVSSLHPPPDLHPGSFFLHHLHKY